MEGYAEHRNKYNVVCLDVTSFLTEIAQRQGAVDEIAGMIRGICRVHGQAAGIEPMPPISLWGIGPDFAKVKGLRAYL